MIKALLFDVDGVLANGDSWGKHLARDYGITQEMLSPFFKEKFYACLVGNADLKEELAEYLHRWGWQKSADDFLHYWFTHEHTIDEPLVTAVQQLRQQSIPCYLATNQEKYRTAYILEHMGFASTFDGIFSSAHIGYAKPDPAFFAYILNQLKDIKAHEMLFWDDSPTHIAAAQQAGLQAEIYTDFADFEQKMKNYI